MAVTHLTISFPDFQLNTTIDPEQFDTNNLEILTKINELVDLFNTTDNRVVTLETFKTDTETALDDRYVKSEVYTKDETDGKYRLISESYTKSEVDNKVFGTDNIANDAITESKLDPALRGGTTDIATIARITALEEAPKPSKTMLYMGGM